MSTKVYFQWALGWVLGNLIVATVLLVASQVIYQHTAKVLFLGFIEGEWVEPPSQKLAALRK